MKLYVFAVFVLLVSCFIELKAQTPVSFFEEHIDFTLNKQYFTINGVYSFRNNSDKSVNQPIIFPFADEVLNIDSIRVENLSASIKVPFKKKEKHIEFELKISSKDTVDINIFYRQKTSQINTYIISSTQSWGKPLEKAIYTLTADKKIKINSFSYLPNSVKQNKKIKTYFWRKENFMPKNEFTITLGH